MEHDHKGQHGDGASARHIVAHFPTESQAREAERRIAPSAASVDVSAVDAERVREEFHQAHEGISTVEIGVPAWIGLLIGALIGALLGALVYANRLTIADLAPALSAGPVATAFLGAGVLGTLGWLLGALLHLLQAPRPAHLQELRTSVDEDPRPEVQEKLAEAGALEVLVEGNGSGEAGEAQTSGQPSRSAHH